jgi:hypothetical protein
VYLCPPVRACVPLFSSVRVYFAVYLRFLSIFCLILSTSIYFFLLTLFNQVGPESGRENFFNDDASFDAYLDRLLDEERPCPMW